MRCKMQTHYTKRQSDTRTHMDNLCIDLVSAHAQVTARSLPSYCLWLHTYLNHLRWNYFVKSNILLSIYEQSENYESKTRRPWNGTVRTGRKRVCVVVDSVEKKIKNVDISLWTDGWCHKIVLVKNYLRCTENNCLKNY